MNDKFRIKETKVDGKEVSIFKVSKECVSILKKLDEYLKPYECTENAVFYQVDGWGWRKRLNTMIIEMSRNKKEVKYEAPFLEGVIVNI